MSANFNFLDLTAKQVQGQNAGNNVQVGGSNDAQKLQKTDVFTAAKKGMQPAAQKGAIKEAPQNTDPNAINAFGDKGGYGDTVLFSTKNTQNNSQKSTTMAGKVGNAVNFGGGNDGKLQELAKNLGIDTNMDENQIKNNIKSKLNSMAPQELTKLKGEDLDNASDFGLIAMNDIEAKMKGNNNDTNSQKQDPNKIKFGAFTSGSEV